MTHQRRRICHLGTSIGGKPGSHSSVADDPWCDVKMCIWSKCASSSNAAALRAVFYVWLRKNCHFTSAIYSSTTLVFVLDWLYPKWIACELDGFFEGVMQRHAEAPRPPYTTGWFRARSCPIRIDGHVTGQWYINNVLDVVLFPLFPAGVTF